MVKVTFGTTFGFFFDGFGGCVSSTMVKVTFGATFGFSFDGFFRFRFFGLVSLTESSAVRKQKPASQLRLGSESQLTEKRNVVGTQCSVPLARLCAPSSLALIRNQSKKATLWHCILASQGLASQGLSTRWQ